MFINLVKAFLGLAMYNKCYQGFMKAGLRMIFLA